jgi:hypothetical protein
MYRSDPSKRVVRKLYNHFGTGFEAVVNPTAFVLEGQHGNPSFYAACGTRGNWRLASSS